MKLRNSSHLLPVVSPIMAATKILLPVPLDVSLSMLAMYVPEGRGYKLTYGSDTFYYTYQKLQSRSKGEGILLLLLRSEVDPSPADHVAVLKKIFGCVQW
jgi:hypothetical protein